MYLKTKPTFFEFYLANSHYSSLNSLISLDFSKKIKCKEKKMQVSNLDMDTLDFHCINVGTRDQIPGKKFMIIRVVKVVR